MERRGKTSKIFASKYTDEWGLIEEKDARELKKFRCGGKGRERDGEAVEVEEREKKPLASASY